MKLLSVNVSLPREVPYKDTTITTGIFKEPVTGRVMARTLNLDGDGQGDRKVHGGPDMAVYAYPVEHYPFWQAELGRAPFPSGQFGENLTVQGLTEETVRVGDVLRVGGALLQVTQPRIPCYKLALRMDEGPEFPARFQAIGRLGFYLRVLEEGEIGAGDTIRRVDSDPGSVTIAEFIRVYLQGTRDPEGLRRVLASRELGDAWRGYLDRLLERAAPEPGPAGWEGYRTFVVDRAVPESEAITSFYLAPRDGKALPPFRPGQFLTLELDIPVQARPVTRTYTISDRPRPDFYRLSIKREPPPAHSPDAPPGLASGYLHQAAGAGTTLRARAPRGDFWLDPDDDTPLVLASAGVGLTPMISMLNAIVAAGSGRPVWFIHGARNGRGHALGAHVRRLAAEHSNIHVYVSYSRPDPGDVEGRDHDGTGHVSTELLKRLLPPAAYDFYLCGPSPFMESLYHGLLDWGVTPSRIRYEFFGPASVLAPGTGTAPASHGVDGGTPGADVVFRRSGLTLAWQTGVESILELAEAHGLRPDSSCRSGICHTCMCRLVSGEVVYTVEPAEPPAPGCVLICCSAPRTDVVIDI